MAITGDIEFRFTPRRAAQPKHLLASAELVVRCGGRLPDMKVTGLALWRAQDEEAITVTLPFRSERHSIVPCLQTLTGRLKDLVAFKRHVIAAYDQWARSQKDLRS